MVMAVVTSVKLRRTLPVKRMNHSRVIVGIIEILPFKYQEFLKQITHMRYILIKTLVTTHQNIFL